MSESNNNAWPFTEISDEEGLDISAIFGNSTGPANQGNPFTEPAAAAAPAPTPAPQETPVVSVEPVPAPKPTAAPPAEKPAPAQPEVSMAAENPIAAAFEQKTAENTKKGLLEKPPVFYHKGVKEDIEDASMTFEGKDHKDLTALIDPAIFAGELEAVQKKGVGHLGLQTHFTVAGI